jgi:ATP-dependent DNA helicase PIF1
MISCKQFGWLDRRCRQIFPEANDIPFAGLNVILFGDFFQLPPVGGKPLFSDDTLSPTNVDELHGRNAYRAFDRTVELDVVMRQQGDSLAQKSFREALGGLRNSKVTREHWQTLSSRVQCQLTIQEVSSFDGALRIYSKKVAVGEYNHSKLRDCRSPVLIIRSTNRPELKPPASSDEAGNLHNVLLLCVGARVMLTENLWTENGLVNGALGTVMDILWSQESNCHEDPPLAVMVSFDGYNGPQLDSNTSNSVPIFRSTRQFTLGTQDCYRSQFPLIVAYAITVHKSQGITVVRATLNIKERDFVPGLSYIAVSRVKTLDGLMFEESFDLARFQSKLSKTVQWRLRDVERRQGQHL